MEHVCAKCEQPKLRTDFPESKYISWCKSCYLADHRRRKKSLMFELDGVMRSGLQLRRKYKLSVEAYIALYDSQGGLCAICFEKPEDKILVVDHSHQSGAIRELLCSACNWALGHSKESKETLLSMINYLEKHNV